jgi:hypothetical protein
VAVVFEGGVEGAGGLRKVVVDAIRNDPETYSEVMLGYVNPLSQPHLSIQNRTRTTEYRGTRADSPSANPSKNTLPPSRNLQHGEERSNYRYSPNTTLPRYPHSTSKQVESIDSAKGNTRIDV